MPGHDRLHIPSRQLVQHLHPVLMIGIATSVFTAVYMTRMWVALWLRKARPADITI